jgi:type IV pilus assembly protein PilM
MPRLIALDLGSHAVKATVFNVASRTQLELTQRYQQPVPQDGVAPTFEHRLAALDALLDDTPTLKPSSSDMVLLAWPSSEAAFHRVGMPFTDKTQIERTLPFAVENEVPFELDEMVLAWRIAEQQDQTYVLAALARQARVAEWLAALDRRGIDPASVHVDADVFGSWGGGMALLVDETPTETLVRTPDGLNRPAEPLVAIIDLGHLHTTISVIRNAAVQYARSINVGGWTFTRAIVEGTGLSWHEAEQLKHISSQPGAEPLAEEARARIEASWATLLAELRSTLIKAEDSLRAEVVEVRLTGGSSQMPGLADAIHADLGVPVRQALDPRVDDTPPEFAVCHALAYTASGGISAPIDLRVGQFVYKGRTDLVRSVLVYGVAGAACFCLAALLMFAVQFRSLAAEQAETEAAVREIVLRSFPEIPGSALESMGKAEAAMAGLTQDAVQRAAVLGNGTGGVPPTVDVLYHLTGAFPPHPEVTVEVSDLTITPVSISLNAETDGFQSSSKVEEALKANPRFHTAVKGQETKLANGRVRFPITIPIGEEAVATDATGEQPETNKPGEEG